MAMMYVIPISIAIVGLMTIVAISYEQTIHAYPGGGGAYIVARDNLGELPAQTAGAALLTDYILTVAVSISSGVAQIVSAFPVLYPYRVILSVTFVLLVMLINLRGVKESGAVFAIPTYFFLIMAFLTVGVGLFRFAMGTLGTVVDPPQAEQGTLMALSLFLILRAFAGGTTALTGVEAISNGITAFRDPKSRNAGITLIWMSAILGTLMLGITFLARHMGAVPTDGGETIISQIARTVFGGRDALYLLTIVATTLILIMAANTAFADFPRLAALHANDGFLPRQLTYRGSRLVFSRGIVALALIACGLIIAFRASVTALIPLYAIGVFLSFTLSQTGMAVRWRKSGGLKPGEELHEPGSVLRFDANWRRKRLVNLFGAAATALVMLIFAVTKFRSGAWVIIVLVPVLVFVFFRIHHHYKTLAHQLSLSQYRSPAPPRRHRVLLTVGGVHQGTLQALQYARLLSPDVTAIHVATNPEETEKVKQKWVEWGEGTRLVILDSPYRVMIEPLLSYVEEILAARQPNERLTIVVPRFVPHHLWHNLLHSNTAAFLRLALLFRPGIIITDVPFYVE
jgi:amino acid transporter